MSVLYLEKNLNLLSACLSIAFKFGVFTGGSCVILYSLRIGHFPQDLSLGDGILFLMAAACFGIVYIFFTISLISLGMLISPLIKIITKLEPSNYHLFFVKNLFDNDLNLHQLNGH